MNDERGKTRVRKRRMLTRDLFEPPLLPGDLLVWSSLLDALDEGKGEIELAILVLATTTYDVFGGFNVHRITLVWFPHTSNGSSIMVVDEDADMLIKHWNFDIVVRAGRELHVSRHV